VPLWNRIGAVPVAARYEDEEGFGGVGVVPVVERAVIVKDCRVGCHGCCH
jgi:hypothetical protein